MIDAISITNFIGIRGLSENFGPINLIAGPNAAGKTSLLDAIRFVLTGDLRRVTLKKDAKAIVSEGAKGASITAAFANETEITRRLPSGDVNGDLPDALRQSQILPLVLDAGRFAALPGNDRRAVLFGLSKTGDSRKWAGDRLAQEGIALPIIDQLLPLLRSGFEPARQTAETKASEARGAWKAITGEFYGSTKADGWRAERPQRTQEPSVLQDEVRRITADQTAARDRLAAIKARGTLGDIPTPKQIADLQGKLAEGETRLAQLREHQATAHAAATAAGGVQCPCPECGAVLVIDRGTLKPYVQPEPGKSAPQSAADAAQLSRDIVAAEQWLSERRGKVSAMQAAITVAASLGDFDADGPTKEEVEASLESLQTALNTARIQLAAAEDVERSLAEADTREAKAAKEHAKVTEWVAAAKLMAPDGLPAELLVRALAPFRADLSNAAPGWPPITLGDDIEIRIGGRPYGLCSESEQWRADAACAVAVANQSGVPLVLLDRLDVLEPAARGPALAWLRTIAECGIQVFVAGTLKGRPTMAGIHTIWLGEAAPAEAAAA